MTVAATSAGRVAYAGANSQGPYPVPFRFMKASDLLVIRADAAGIETRLTLGSDYTVTGADLVEGGAITTKAAVPVGSKLTIVLDMTVEQPLVYVQNDPFPAKSHERGLDRLTIIAQQLMERYRRAISFSVTDGLPAAIPRARERAGKLMGFDPAGTLTMFAPKDFAKGDPGGNTMAIGAFTAAAALLIPIGTDMVQTTGYAMNGSGSARYVADPAVNAAYVAGRPRTSFISANGRGFRLAETTLDVRMVGATGDDATNDSAALEAARRCGAQTLVFPAGGYRTDGFVIDETDDVTALHFHRGAFIRLIAAPNRIGVDIQKHNFHIGGAFQVRGTGSHNDGLNTIGVRHGTTIQGRSYLTIDWLIVHDHFSARGFVSYACVDVKINRADINAGHPLNGSTCYGMAFEPGMHGCTMVEIAQAYLSGGKRAFYGNALSWFDGTLTYEYAGTGGDAETDEGARNGAFHLERCNNFTLRNRYGEQNLRNMVLIDSVPVFIGGGHFVALAASNYCAYSGVPFDERGVVEIVGNAVYARRLRADRTTARSLMIGDDIEVGLDDKARFGRMRTATTAGILAAANTWTTIAPLSGQTGDAFTRMAYRYTVALGRADQTHGFDSGTIMNGVLYSDRGAAPDWLRVDAGAMQVNRPGGTSYGLEWGLTLYPMTAA